MSTNPTSRPDTKASIRDVAIRLIRARGFEQTSLREIAEEVGITKASVYYHYPSKVALLEAILEPIFELLYELDQALEEFDRDRAGVRELMSRYLRGLVRHRQIGSLVLADPTVLNSMAERSVELVAIASRIQQWLAGPDPSVQALLRARCAFEAAGVALSAGDVVPQASDDEIVDELLTVVSELLRL